jgi:hypothetical protein
VKLPGVEALFVPVGPVQRVPEQEYGPGEQPDTGAGPRVEGDEQHAEGNAEDGDLVQQHELPEHRPERRIGGRGVGVDARNRRLGGVGAEVLLLGRVGLELLRVQRVDHTRSYVCTGQSRCVARRGKAVVLPDDTGSVSPVSASLVRDARRNRRPVPCRLPVSVSGGRAVLDGECRKD